MRGFLAAQRTKDKGLCQCGKEELAVRAARHLVKILRPMTVVAHDCPISQYCAGVACSECFEDHLLLCHPILASVIWEKTDVWAFRD